MNSTTLPACMYAHSAIIALYHANVHCIIISVTTSYRHVH